MSAPIPFSDWRRVYDAVPNARLFPWQFVHKKDADKPDKVPMFDRAEGIEHGKDDSTRDPEILTRWAKRWPDALLGIVHTTAGFVDADLDDDGNLPAEHAERARTLTPGAVDAESVSGALHRWVRAGGLEVLYHNRPAHKMGGGIEWRGPLAGFAALTESDLNVLSGELPAASDELIALVIGKAKPEPIPVPTEQTADPMAISGVNRKLADFAAAAEGGRRDALNEAALTAGGFHGAGRLPEAKATALLAIAIESAEQNGAMKKYGESGIAKIWKEGFSDGVGKPLHKRSTVRAKEREEAELKRDLAKANAVLSGQSLIDNGTKMQLARGALQAIGPACRYNTRRRQTEISMNGRWTLIGDWAYVLALQIADQCSTVKQDRVVPVDVKPANVVEALTGMSTRVDPFLAWLETRPTTAGTTAIDGFLHGHFGADPVIGPWAMRHILLTAVTRAYEPGYLVAEHVVLIGKGGSGKSAMLKHLLPPEGRAAWHSDSLSLSMSRKEIGEILAGRVIVECGDMAGAASLKDLGRLKTMLTAVDDGGERGAFKVAADEQLRMQTIVFTGDTRRVLPPDDTGNFRRWAPVELALPDGPIEPLLDQVRDALWGEAMALYRVGERPSVPPAVQAALAPVRARSAARADLIEHYADQLSTERYPNGATIMQLLIDAEVPEQDRGKLAGRFGSMLSAKGWESARESRQGKRATVWRFVGRLDLAARGSQGPGVSRGLLEQCETPPLPIGTHVEGAAANTRNGDTPTTPVTPATPGSQPEPEQLLGLDSLKAELVCRRCGGATLPAKSGSGLCVRCEVPTHA